MDRATRTRQLNQVPVFALRKMIYGLITDNEVEMQRRVRETLDRRPRDLRRAIQRYVREQLVKLINACPEISDEEVSQLFEAYRYGSNPSFHIFLFSDLTLAVDVTGDSVGFRGRLEEALLAHDEDREDEPRFQHLVLNDLSALPGRKEIIEGNYRFQKRLDYIDAEQNAVSTYETLYGFFWLNTADGYAIIHARNRDVLKGLRTALESAVNIHLTPLVITKYLKNKIPFLLEDALRSSRLHDPDPDKDRFRWMSVTDDDPYAKGYRALEEGYPELRSARYREWVDETKETSLTIRCTQGVLSLAGRLQASQFRGWCVDRLGQIVTVLDELQSAPIAFVETRGLAHVPEMAKLTSGAQRDHVRWLIAALLALRKAPGKGYRELDGSPLALAADLKDYLRVQVPITCEECGQEEGTVTCPTCGETELVVERQEGGWALVCPKHRNNRWRVALPLEGRCDEEHRFELDTNSLEEDIVLLPGDDLLHIMASVISRYLQVFKELDPEQEGFYLRGRNLYYSEDKTGLWDEKRGPVTNVFLTQKARVIEAGGTMAGVVRAGD